MHAIGDLAVRRVLDLFESHAANQLEAFLRERRWRIEHTQMVHPDDMRRIRGACVAVQPIHFTADLPWAAQRLGQWRLPWS
ncbi:MAG: amidohydrolase family protein, partial [Alkalispirochaeta sp.]